MQTLEFVVWTEMCGVLEKYISPSQLKLFPLTMTGKIKQYSFSISEIYSEIKTHFGLIDVIQESSVKQVCNFKASLSFAHLVEYMLQADVEPNSKMASLKRTYKLKKELLSGLYELNAAGLLILKTSHMGGFFYKKLDNYYKIYKFSLLSETLAFVMGFMKFFLMEVSVMSWGFEVFLAEFNEFLKNHYSHLCDRSISEHQPLTDLGITLESLRDKLIPRFDSKFADYIPPYMAGLTIRKLYDGLNTAVSPY